MINSQFPTIRRRVFSYLAAYFTAMFWGVIYLAPGVFVQTVAFKLGFENAGKVLGGVLHALTFVWITYRLSLFGMTMRHLISGYSIRSAKNQLPLNVFMLYIREVICVFSGILVFFKVIAPSLLKRGIDTVNDDKHVVTQVNGNLYVSAQSVGSMKDDRMNSEISDAVQNEVVKIAENGFLHDKIFQTYAIMTPRWTAFKGIFSLTSPRFQMAPTSTVAPHPAKSA